MKWAIILYAIMGYEGFVEDTELVMRVILSWKRG